MIDADAPHEAEQQALGQLAQMDLALAARLHALAMTCDDPQEILELTRAYQRAGSSAPRKGARPCSLAIEPMRNPALLAPSKQRKNPTVEVGFSGRPSRRPLPPRNFAPI